MSIIYRNIRLSSEAGAIIGIKEAADAHRDAAEVPKIGDIQLCL